MTGRRLYVVWTHPIFHESVRLLLNHPSVEWVGAASDCEVGLSEILALKPDTILMEETEEACRFRATDILEVAPWNVRVLSMSLNENRLSIFHREQKTVGQAEDLLHLVLNEF